MEEETRNLTDADVKAIVKEMRQEFYQNLGAGVWGLVWKVIVIGLVALAAYGAGKRII